MKEKVKPGPAARCSTKRHSTGWNRKMASCFTLLRRNTNSKVSIQRSFRISKCQVLAWKSFPRRVHATLTNPAWITHLLRNIFANSDVECILRAKTLQLNLTGAIEWSEVRNLRLKFGWHLTVQLNNNRKHSMTCPPAATWMRPGATLQVQKFASKLPSSWFP